MRPSGHRPRSDAAAPSWRMSPPTHLPPRPRHRRAPARPAAASPSASGPRPAVRRRVALGQPAVRLGRPLHLGAGARGARALYISFAPDIAVPGRRRDRRGVRRARGARGRRSGSCCCRGRGEEEAGAPSGPCGPRRPRPDDRARRVGSCRTSARASCSTTCSSGEIALPAGDVAEPFVDADDIAEVAVAALTEDGHAGRLYELTGPRLLTFADAVAEIAGGDGPRDPYVAVPPEDYAAALAARACRGRRRAAHLPVHRGDRRSQRLASPTASAGARPPARDFTAYAAAVARTGAWRVTAAAGR